MGERIGGRERERKREREREREQEKEREGGWGWERNWKEVEREEGETITSSLLLSSYIGRLNISEVFMSGVSDALSSHQDGEAKGIKAHFRMDESGLLVLDYVSLYPHKQFICLIS